MSVKLQRQPGSVPQPYILLFKKIPIFDLILQQEVVETIRLKLQYHRDPERAEQIKQIKGW